MFGLGESYCVAALQACSTRWIQSSRLAEHWKTSKKTLIGVFCNTEKPHRQRNLPRMLLGLFPVLPACAFS